MRTEYRIGVDLGGTAVKFGLFNADTALLKKWQMATDVSENGSHIIPQIAASILATLAEEGISKEDVRGVGIGIPGTVIDGVVARAVNLFWKDVPLVREMEARLSLPVVAGNDANMAALGEMTKGSGGGFRSALFVTLGTGVGGAVILDGKVWTGAHGCAAEIGHMHVSDELTIPCNCGQCGCLEQFAAAPGILRLAQEALTTHPAEETVLSRDAMTVKDIFDAARAGDAVAQRVISKMTSMLGMGMANMAALLDPEIIIVGGGIAQAGDVLFSPLRACYQAYAFSTNKETPIVQASLGNDAGICGAAALSQASG